MVDFLDSKKNQFTYEDWNMYFAGNNERRLTIDFSGENYLSMAQQRLIFPSIREFQKGEGSDGRHLMEAVEKFVNETGLKECRKAMERFVREENWHSAYLRKYMDFYHIKVKRKSFLDKAFRKLRRLGGLKCEVTVLVTAEMIALTYYDALSKSTDSPALKSICSQMLHDEVPHIMFQSYTLGHFRNGFAEEVARAVLMETTLLFVWGAFHKVYQAGGYGFTSYLKENLGYLRQSALLSRRRLPRN